MAQEPVYVAIICSGGVVQEVLHGEFVESTVWDWDDFNDSDERALEMLREAVASENPYLNDTVIRATKELLQRPE